MTSPMRKRSVTRGGIVAQRAQPLRLRLQGLVALQAELRQAQLRLQPGLVRAQRVARRDAFAKPLPALEGTGDGHLHRVGDHREQHCRILPRWS